MRFIIVYDQLWRVEVGSIQQLEKSLAGTIQAYRELLAKVFGQSAIESITIRASGADVIMKLIPESAEA